ncbi:hypothetical protein ACRALDRAFT_2026416 [Sodiomyces alcalophilus JCM 7366]|uniref:uncharacterized protein n=1 Tax=Sodiomyces alcalophilus JCM 7366 TaxID=591952 RepID=UPI0039B5CF3B
MANIPTADPASSRRPSLSQPASRRHPRSRSQSISSDRPSTIMSHGLASPPMGVSPEAAFIAPSAASQIVTNDHDSHADTWYDQHGIETSGETVLVSPTALQLVNDFLDQLLFSFLQLSRSTTLAALRPAVSEVLKPKLAKDVINNADEELREYLGGADEEDFVPADASQAQRDWDPELVWKRTRLRCMVYSSLGDMEEEDEDYYTEHENLEPGVDERGSDLISPAVAIFLTSILEYMGEAALVVAGQAACHRMQTAFEKDLREGVKTTAVVADRIVVQDFDMERVALDRTLGRLWRGWKKRIRGPAADTPRSFSRASFSTHGRQRSIVGEIPSSDAMLPEGEEEPATENKEDVKEKDASAAINSRVEDYVRASAIPLPVGQHDVDEIEVPGLVSYSDDEEHADAEHKTTIGEREIRRPKSMMVFSPRLAVELPPSPAIVQPGPPLGPIPSARKRSVSLPAPSQLLYASPLAKRPKFETSSSDAVEQCTPAGDAQKNEDIALPRDVGGRDSKHAVEKPQESVTASELGEQEQKDPAPEIRRRSSKRLSRFVNSATLAGATATAAAAAAAATANREPRHANTAPETGATTPAIDVPKEEDVSSDSEIEEFDEEPQILTSARISYAGRTSPAVSVSSKGSSININTNVPMRTPSVHSARVIDVVGPKSPAHSRPHSTEREERVRQVSVHRPPTVEERAGPAVSAPAPRPLADRATPRSGTSLAISTSPDDVEGPAAPPSRPSDLAHGIAELPAQPIYGTVVRQPASARHENGPAITATLWNTSNPSARTASSSPTSSPAKSPQQQQQQQTHPSGASQRNADKAKHAHSTSIGMVSVERHSPTAESSEPARQVYTSGSSASSGTGKLRPVRTSEDSKRSFRPDHVARDFDELIQSDQTIQYTLTPEHVRNMTSVSPSHSTVVLPTRSKGADDVRTTVNGDWSRAEANATTRKPSLPGPESKSSSASGAGYVPKAPTDGSSGKPKPGGIQARDARVPRESVNDFADFIRSTGPAVDNSPRPVPLANAAEKAASIKKSTDLRRLASQNKSRPRLQARDAAVDSRGDNSDLIDFIRRGPPGAQDHRIPRNVAPFRTTMDSDQMAGAVGGRAVDATLPDMHSSRASTSVTDTTMTSVQSSIHSQSALLRNDRQTGVIEEEDFMPKRTRRRIRDPYAIDLSDEEDEYDYDLAVKPPPKREESLAEFLRNYEPPPSEPTRPIAPANKPKKKSSAPSLMGRFSRSFQGISQTNAHHGDTARPSPADAAPPPHSSNGARAYTPIQVTMTGANDNKYAAGDGLPPPLSQPSGTRSSSRILMKKYEPREATSSVSRTNDLADFLRDSEPPPQMPASMSAHRRDDEHASSSGFSKMFSRRKKSIAYP